MSAFVLVSVRYVLAFFSPKNLPYFNSFVVFGECFFAGILVCTTILFWHSAFRPRARKKISAHVEEREKKTRHFFPPFRGRDGEMFEQNMRIQSAGGGKSRMQRRLHSLLFCMCVYRKEEDGGRCLMTSGMSRNEIAKEEKQKSGGWAMIPLPNPRRFSAKFDNILLPHI